MPFNHYSSFNHEFALSHESSICLSISPYDKEASDDDNTVTNEQYTNSFRSRNNHWIVLVDDEESIRLAIGTYVWIILKVYLLQ